MHFVLSLIVGAVVAAWAVTAFVFQAVFVTIGFILSLVLI